MTVECDDNFWEEGFRAFFLGLSEDENPYCRKGRESRA